MTNVAQPRRLETGDWVRLRGDDPSIRGVGKLVDGDFAAEDHALTACLVEVGARSIWLSPADLTRVTPDEEARLCDVALARGLVPAERRARLDAALREYRAGRRAVIRTPGLLDLLWATSGLADPTHGSGAVTAFLAEEALGARAAAPSRAPMPTPAPTPPPATAPLPHGPAAPPAPTPPRATAPRPPVATPPPLEARLARVLSPLDRAALIELAARCAVDLGPHPAALDAVQVQRQLGRAGITAVQAMAALDPRQPPGEVLEQALAVLDDHQVAGLAEAACGSPGRLREALAMMTQLQLHGLCDRLGMEPMWAVFDAQDVRERIEAVSGAVTAILAPPAPLERAQPRPPPRAAAHALPPEEVLTWALEVLSRDRLFALARRFGLTPIANEKRAALVAEALQALPPVEPLRHLLATMSDTELQLLWLRLGLERDGNWDAASVRARIADVAGLPPDGPP